MSNCQYVLSYDSGHEGLKSIACAGNLLIIGRSAESDIVVSGKSASEVAAKIEPCGNSYLLTVLAAGKVRVNGKKVSTHELKAGDRIEAGESVINCSLQNPVKEQTDTMARGISISMARFAEAVGRERDLKKLLNRIMNILIELLGGTDAFIFLINSNGKPEEFVSTGTADIETRFSDTIVQKVLATGTGVCVENALCNPEFCNAQSVADLKIASALCCPVTVAGKTSGVIYLGSRKAGHSYSKNDLSVLNTYSILAGMIVNHVEFISQQQASIHRLTSFSAFDGVVGESDVMKKVFAAVISLEHSDIPVLIEGETGTGKDVIANLVHKKSKRAAMPFVAVNCSSLRGELLESELFGHVKGAFTGAVKDHGGLCLAANSGTLFLDEIGEMDISLQAKLLRMLENGMIRPVGSSAERNVDIRLVFATNRNLQEMVEDRLFRQDLYFRINQFRIPLPPVRNRGEDAVLLAYFFLEKFKTEYPHKNFVDFDASSLRTIAAYEWPGNVREIANSVHKAVLMSAGPLVEMDLPDTGSRGPESFEAATRDFQKTFLLKSIRACNGNKEETAKMLGMSRSTFFRYTASLGI
jgi:transcriptional regulator with GAF, ATPase, and Fis domain